MRRWALVGVMTLGFLSGAPGYGDLADPTRPSLSHRPPRASPKAAKGALILRSVMLSEHRRVAVINGQRVQTGDDVLGARVVEIGLTGVRLRRKGQQILLTLTDDDFKKSSPENWNLK